MVSFRELVPVKSVETDEIVGEVGLIGKKWVDTNEYPSTPHFDSVTEAIVYVTRKSREDFIYHEIDNNELERLDSLL